MRILHILFLAIVICISIYGESKADGKSSGCNSKEADIAIPSCTREIGSGKWTGKKLSEFYYNRSGAYLRKGQFDKAIADLNSAMELNPCEVKIYGGLCYLLAITRQFKKAIPECNKAIALDPKLSKAYNNRCFVLNEIGNHDKAIRDCSKAIELEPKVANPYNHRANAFTKIGQYERALNDYNKAIELNQNYTAAYVGRAICYQKLGMFDKAIIDAERCLKLDPDNSDCKLIINGIARHSIKTPPSQRKHSKPKTETKDEFGDPPPELELRQ